MISLIKDSSLMLITRVMSVGMSLVTNVIIARELGPSFKGSFSIILLIMSTASLLTLFGLGGANIYIGAQNPKRIPTLLGNSIVAAVGFGLIGITVVEVSTLLPEVQVYFIENGVEVHRIRLLVFLLPVTLLSSYLEGIVRATGRIIYYNLLTVAQVTINLISVIALVLMLQGGMEGAIQAWIIAQLGAGGFSVFVSLKLVNSTVRFEWQDFKESLGFGLRLYLGNIAQFLNYRLDIFFIGAFLSPASIGYYTVATTVAERLWEFPTAIRTAFMYHVSSSSENSADFTARVARTVAAVVGMMGILLVLLAYPFTEILYGSDYIPAAPAIILLMPGIWALGVGRLLAVFLASKGQPEIGSVSAGISLVFTIILDLFLIPNFGILGAALASSVSYTMAAVVLIVIYLRATGQNLSDILIIRGSDVAALWNTIAKRYRIWQARRLAAQTSKSDSASVN